MLFSESRPGGEQGRGPPTGKFMRPSGLRQLWGAEFENGWYTGDGWGFQPHFRNLKSRSGENSLKVNKAKGRGDSGHRIVNRQKGHCSFLRARIFSLMRQYGVRRNEASGVRNHASSLTSVWK